MPDSLSAPAHPPGPDLSAPIARHLRIHGTVQGVYYRQSTVEAAQRLAVAGWVRNRSDGSVEAVVSGTDDAAEALVAWARSGPPLASVTEVYVRLASELELGPATRPMSRLPTL